MNHPCQPVMQARKWNTFSRRIKNSEHGENSGLLLHNGLTRVIHKYLLPLFTSFQLVVLFIVFIEVHSAALFALKGFFCDRCGVITRKATVTKAYGSVVNHLTKWLNREISEGISLAESEKELGLPITQEQIDELKAHADDINYEVAQEREKIVRHDVMSHVYAYGVQCPNAKGIIHLGATSCYVGDNTDIIIMTEGLKLIRNKLITVIRNLSKFADEYKALQPLWGAEEVWYHLRI